MPTQIQDVLKEQAETAQRNIETLEAELTRLQVNPLVSAEFIEVLHRTQDVYRQLIANLMSAIAIAH